MANMSIQERSKLGNNGMVYATKHFDNRQLLVLWKTF